MSPFTAIIRCDSQDPTISYCQPSDFYFVNTTGAEIIEKMTAGEFVNIVLYRPFVYGETVVTYSPSIQTAYSESAGNLFMLFREYACTDEVNYVMLYWNVDANAFTAVNEHL